MNAVQGSVFGGGKPTNDAEEPVDERLKGIEPKMIELVMNEVCLCKKKLCCLTLVIKLLRVLFSIFKKSNKSSKSKYHVLMGRFCTMSELTKWKC